jgi:putative SOS response-associated peptidase YedK
LVPRPRRQPCASIAARSSFRRPYRRSKGLATSGAYAQSFRLRRCLIPASGFYELRAGCRAGARHATGSA